MTQRRAFMIMMTVRQLMIEDRSRSRWINWMKNLKGPHQTVSRIDPVQIMALMHSSLLSQVSSVTVSQSIQNSYRSKKLISKLTWRKFTESHQGSLRTRLRTKLQRKWLASHSITSQLKKYSLLFDRKRFLRISKNWYWTSWAMEPVMLLPCARKSKKRANKLV